MKKVVDPVCHMEIDPETAAGKSVFEGETYYFCNLNCKKRFDAGPGRFLKDVKSKEDDDK